MLNWATIAQNTQAGTAARKSVMRKENKMPIAVHILLVVLFGSSSFLAILFVIAEMIGMCGIFRKCGVTPWWGFVPYWRDYNFSVCAGRAMEGRVLVALDVVQVLLEIVAVFMDPASNIALLFSLGVVLFYIVAYFIRIRIYLGLFEVFQAKRLWIIPALLIPGLVLIIFGWSKKKQPQWTVADFRRNLAASLSGATVQGMNDGLTVNLEERTVREMFEKKYLLRDIHLYVKPGRMVLLLGGSGAGKTTFLNAVIGYERAKAKVTLNGGDVYESYKKMQYEIGYVPQQELMRPTDTVLRTLDDSALLRLPMDLSPAMHRERVTEVMKIFGLEPLADSLVQKLSGGQKKRLSIAMEFVSNPTLFILDEPDSGLDGVMARELMEQLRRIADQGKIVIVITHTPDRVIDLFDDVIVLAKDANRTGRLAFFGPIEEARSFFGKERMEQIVMSVNREEDGGEGRADEFIEKYAEVLHA